MSFSGERFSHLDGESGQSDAWLVASGLRMVVLGGATWRRTSARQRDCARSAELLGATEHRPARLHRATATHIACGDNEPPLTYLRGQSVARVCGGGHR